MSGAVFLSYAREDTAAAHRIAEALRSHGVEVWFDQSELRGGDAWDQKIRKQVKECSLFVPVISAHTQDRHEGYFRLEWKLAVDRTHLMLEGVPFLAPVVIDDTPDSGAAVPGEFLRVQWTRLPGALPTPQFVEQLKRLLAAPPKPVPVPELGTRIQSHVPIRQSAFARWAAVGLGAGMLALVAYLALRPPAKEPAMPTVSDKSIAVLPFENMSDDKANAYFCDGVQEDILTDLANISDLRVVSRTSVEQYRGTTKPIRQIASELGVAWILEGSVQRSDNKVRVTGQLINAATDEHKWAKAYNRDLADIFAIQSELAGTIASSLQAVLSPQERTLLERKPTKSIAAYESVLKSRELQKRPQRGLDAFQQEEGLLLSAVQIDPNYAIAYSDLSFVYAFGRYYLNTDLSSDISQSWVAKAKDAIDQAVRLAPDSPDTILGLGDYYYYGLRDFPRATDQYQKVIRLRPNDPTAYLRLAAIQRRQSQWVESLSTFRKADKLDPGNLHNVEDLAHTLAAGRRFDEAATEQRRVVSGQPGDLRASFTLAELAFIGGGSTREMEQFFEQLSPMQSDSEEGYALRLKWALIHGDLDEAVRIDHLQSQFRGSEGGSVQLDEAFEIAVVLAARGDIAAARARLGDFPAQLRTRVESAPQDLSATTNSAMMEALLGHREEALRCAREAYEMMPESRDALMGGRTRAVLAFVYAWTGDKNAAIAEYGRLLRTPFADGVDANLRKIAAYVPDATIQVMKFDPLYFPLRGDPRFEALINDPKNNEPLF